MAGFVVPAGIRCCFCAGSPLCRKLLRPSRRRKPKLPSTRPPGAPPDPWTAFAETSERSPGRIRRALRRVGRVFIHEYALVTYPVLVGAGILDGDMVVVRRAQTAEDGWAPPTEDSRPTSGDRPLPMRQAPRALNIPSRAVSTR